MQYFWLITLLLIVIFSFTIPVRQRKIKFNEKNQSIKIYEEEKLYLDQKLTKGTIDKNNYDSLLSELDQKTALAISKIDEKKFSYQKGLIPLLIVILSCTGVSLIFYFIFYTGTVKDWQNFQSKYSQQITNGVSGPELDSSVPKDQLALYCFALQKEVLKDYERHTKQQLINLARCHLQVGFLSLARDAIYEGLSSSPNDPEFIFLIAELQMIDQGRLDQSSINGLMFVLQDNPNHFGSLWLLGINYYQNGELEKAALFLTKIKDIGIDDDKISEILNQILNEIEKNSATKSTASNSDKSVNLIISIPANISESLVPPSTIYIISKTVTGDIVNIGRVVIDDFNQSINYSITDNQPGLMKNKSISDQEKIQVQARLSISGDPIASTGDITSKPILIETNQTSPVAITIDQVIAK